MGLDWIKEKALPWRFVELLVTKLCHTISLAGWMLKLE